MLNFVQNARAALMLAFAGGLAIAATPEGTGRISQAKIKDTYKDGDFENAISQLEAFRKAHRAYNGDDSVFIAKYLGVMYAAEPATREKGKYFLNQMLELRPDATLADMYVSDDIYRIFERLSEENRTRRKSESEAPRSQTVAGVNPPTAGKSPGKTEIKSGSRGYWWAAGAVTVIAAGGAYYYFSMAEKKKAQDETDVVPNPNPH
jgi:hypothetical protein